MKNQKKTKPLEKILISIPIYIKNQLFGIIATVIACVTLYLTFFYKIDDLELSVLGSLPIRSKGILTVDVLYNNKATFIKPYLKIH